MNRSAITINTPTIATKPKKWKVHAIDALLDEINGELYGYSLCGVYARSMVEPQFVTCKNCLKMLANEATTPASKRVSRKGTRK